VRTVLHLIETDGPGGAETVYVQLIRSLDPSRWRSVAVLPGRGWVYDQLVESGVRPIVLAERHSFDIRFFARLLDILKKERVDIIHSHLFGSAVRAALVSKWSGVPAIGTLHGQTDIATAERFRSTKINLIDSGLRRIVFVSENLRASYMESAPFRKDRTSVIPNGIDVDRFSTPRNGSFRSEMKFASGDFIVGAIGNPGPAKGLDVFLKAARILKSRDASYRFVIAGDLSRGRGSDVIALRDSLGLTDDVALPGFRADVGNVLASFDVYALTSRSEGFSLSIVEAMASSLPIVATRCGGPEEILSHNESGLLVENGSPEAVAAAIELLREDPGKRARLGKRAREVACERFAISETVEAYERLYEACLARSESRRVDTSAKCRVLVTDGNQRAALAAVRSLGNAGYEVHVCSPRAASIAGSSRQCSGSHQVADALHQPDRFIEDLDRLVTRLKPRVLLPISEAALLAILPERDRFACAIPFPDAAAFTRICDKRGVLAAAESHGIRVPAQTEIASARDAERLNGQLQFPVVLKPYRSVAGDAAGRVSTGVSYATTLHELRSSLERIPRAAFPILLQQRIDGPGFAISVLVWDGELRAAFAHRRIREKPPSGGVSVLRESIPLDQNLLARSLDLLRVFSWQGVAMVEYKLDSATGVPFLMEINGRLWGSLQLAIDAGVDFPALLVEAVLGGISAPVIGYKAGVRSRWEWGDVDHLLATFLHSPGTLALPAGAYRHRRIRALAGFLRAFGRSNRPEIFRLRDPAPFLRETRDWFRGR
jgi:glycosyltransferase involved in cell wall biosynthesis/predicted ATP-grasp superfamily ATP-dependent carboligase